MTKDLSLQERVVEKVFMKVKNYVLRTHISVVKMTLKSQKYRNLSEIEKKNNNNNLKTNSIPRII